MLLRRIIAQQQDRRCADEIAQGSLASGVALEGSGEGRVIRRAVMIDIVGAEHRAREFLQQVIFFVGRPV